VASGVAADSVLLINSSNQVTKTTRAALFAGSGWALIGNTGTSSSSNFIGTTDSIDFVTRTNNTERMRVAANGNVGIGVNAPTSRLTISGAGSDDVGVLQIRPTGADWWSYASSSINESLPVNGTIVHVFGRSLSSYNAGYIGFNYVGAGSLSNFLSLGHFSGQHLLNIQASGNVGIGTTTPTARLQVTGGNVLIDTVTSGTAGQLQLRNPAGTFQTSLRAGAQTADITYTLPTVAPAAGQVLSSDASGIMSWTTPSATSWSLTGNALSDSTTQYLGSSNAYPVSIRTNNTERVRVTSSGNVGVNTASPNTTLDVDGGVSVRPNSVNVTADNQVITVGNRSHIVLTSDGTPANRTITLTGGSQAGQLLFILVSGTGVNGIEIADTGNAALTGTASLDNLDVIQLIWDGSVWREITRSLN
jgi:hypothetical protein